MPENVITKIALSKTGHVMEKNSARNMKESININFTNLSPFKN